jgi:excinuclease UvrABC ATPase subunit
MTSFPSPATRFACDSCAGSGREYVRRHVDVYHIMGDCPDCRGTGELQCQDCGQDVASGEYALGARTWLLCAHCLHQWLEADDAFHTNEEESHNGHAV